MLADRFEKRLGGGYEVSAFNNPQNIESTISILIPKILQMIQMLLILKLLLQIQAGLMCKI